MHSIDDPVSFTLIYNEALSNENYETYSILIFPENDTEQTPYIVCVFPVNKQTLEINLVDIDDNILPIGIQAKYKENENHVISVESIKDIIEPRIIMILTMTITGYNLILPEEQKAVDMEEKLTAPLEEFPQGEKFTFDNVDEFLKFTENND